VTTREDRPIIFVLKDEINSCLYKISYCHWGKLSLSNLFPFTFNDLLQGVSRPTKYHLLWNDDDNMKTDELEQLTYYLCHMFSRCTRSVSYPAPTYNAHLAAYRARVYLEG
jgi:hypothetical protein